MGFIKIAATLRSSELLLQQNKFEQVARALSMALAGLQDREVWQKAQELLEQIPYRVRVETLEIAFLYAKTLMFNHELQKLTEFNRQAIEFHGVAVAGKLFAKPPEYGEGMTVRVVAQGVLTVRVNDRPVAIAPTGRAGELLVYLLEQNGHASVDMMMDAMFPNFALNERDKVRGSIWKFVKNLRRALGWKTSIISLRGAYQLDPSATWEYDVKEARASRNFQGGFLKGVYSNWALETGRTLIARPDLRRRLSDLN
jgi:hypothetical protein